MDTKEYKAHLYRSKIEDNELSKIYEEISFLHQKNRLMDVVIRNSKNLLILQNKILAYKKAYKKLNEIQDTVNSFWREKLWFKISKRIDKLLSEYLVDAIKHDKASEIYCANLREYEKLTKNVNYKLKHSK